MKFIPASITSKVSRQALIVSKNSPTILFTTGIVLGVASTVVACRATLRLDDALEETREKRGKMSEIKHLQESKLMEPEKYTEDDRQKDMLIIYARTARNLTKLYGPSLIMGSASIVCLTGSYRILTNRNVALSAAYALVSTAFADYRGRVVAELGEDKDREFRYGAETRTIVEEQPSGQMKKIDVTRVGPAGASMYAKFFGQDNKNWQRAAQHNLTFIRQQQQYANDRLQAKGHVMLNDVYDDLGFERTSAGCVVGWVKNYGDNYIDFGVFTAGSEAKVRDFVNGFEGAILLDFNVDGEVYKMIDEISGKRK